MNAITLTTTQRETLEHAIEHIAGRIEWFPASVKGGARGKVLQGLLARDLVAEEDGHHVVTDTGYAALGRERLAPRAPEAKANGTPEDAAAAVTAAEARDDLEQAVTAAEATWHWQTAAEAASEASEEDAERAAPPKRRQPRGNSKQAQVIALLRRPEGATVDEIRQRTGWLPHTVRGAFSGTLKKRLGLNVTSEKAAHGERVYRIVEAVAGQEQDALHAEASEGKAA
jgi:hypothetical protein